MQKSDTVLPRMACGTTVQGADVKNYIRPTSAHIAVPGQDSRYYRDRPRYYHCYGRNQDRPEAQRLGAVLPQTRYYRSPLRYYRKAKMD